MNKTFTFGPEEAYTLFREYRDAYTAEWQRLDRCERMYRGEHWADVPMEDPNEPRPATPIIQSTIENVRVPADRPRPSISKSRSARSRPSTRTGSERCAAIPIPFMPDSISRTI